jgi:hypothetical protein|nr:MAG TPA: hypothetical protein [Caudoviricetes sp.]
MSECVKKMVLLYIVVKKKSLKKSLEKSLLKKGDFMFYQIGVIVERLLKTKKVLKVTVNF